jgi:drug/metabolite transporter (DMT)-like permease
MPRFQLYAALAASIIGVSFSAVLNRLSASPALVINLYRVAFALLLLAPVAVRPTLGALRRAPPRDLLACLAAGTMLALHLMAWTTSLRLTSIASAVILVTSDPLFVMAASFLVFRERVPGRAMAWAFLAMLGAVAVGANDWRGGPAPLLGDLLALAGAFLMAGYLIVGRGVRRRLELLPYVFLVYLACAAWLLLGCLLTRTPLGPYPAREWGLFLLLALLPTLLGHTVFNWALAYVSASAVAVTLLGEPVGAMALAALILGEYPGVVQVAGGAAVLLGLYRFVRSSVGRSTGRHGEDNMARRG